MSQTQWTPLEQLPNDRLEANLTVLRRRHPHLYRLFETRKPTCPVEVCPEQIPWFACRVKTPEGWVPVHGGAMPVAEEHQRLQGDISQFWSWGGKVLYLCEVGLGLAAGTNLQFIQEDPTRRMVIVQEEVSSLLAGMALYDFRPLFESDQVLWILGMDVRERLSKTILSYNLVRRVYFKIAAGSLLAEEPRFTSIVETIKKTHQEYQKSRSTALWPELSRYYKDHDLFQINRILAIDFYPHRPGGWILNAAVKAMRQLGLQVDVRSESAHHSDAAVLKNHIVQVIAETKPDLIFTITFPSSEYLPQEIFDQLNVLRVTYSVDHELPVWSAFNHFDILILTMSEMVGVLESHIGQKTDFLPVVSHLERRGRITESLEAPLSFVGGLTSMPPSQVSERRREMERHHPGIWGLVQNLIGTIAQCERSASIYEIVDEEVKKLDPPLSERGRWSVLFMANRLGADLYRRRLLGRVVRFQPWIFAGDCADLEADSPLQPFLKGRIEPDRLPDLYASSAINLNIHCPGNTHTPSTRVFNVAQANGFQLCDPLLELRHFYSVPEEIPVYSNEDDLLEKIGYYLEHPAERQNAAERSCKRTEQLYTFERWARRLFSIVQRRLQERFDTSRTLEIPFQLIDQDLTIFPGKSEA